MNGRCASSGRGPIGAMSRLQILLHQHLLRLEARVRRVSNVSGALGPGLDGSPTAPLSSATSPALAQCSRRLPSVRLDRVARKWYLSLSPRRSGITGD